MSEVLETFLDSTSSTANTLESTPKRRRTAIELLEKQEEEELSENDMVDLLNIVLWAHSFIDLLLYMVIFTLFYHIDIISYIPDISDIFSSFFLIFPKPSL